MNKTKFDVLISQDARTDESTFRGANVKRAYYTAGYKDGSTERQLGGVNHTNTYVVAGKELGFPEIQDLDLLVRTGNGASSIRPKVRAIEYTDEGESREYNSVTKTKTWGYYDGFKTTSLPPELERRIDDALGLTKTYESIAEMYTALGGNHPLLKAIKLNED